MTCAGLRRPCPCLCPAGDCWSAAGLAASPLCSNLPVLVDCSVGGASVATPIGRKPFLEGNVVVRSLAAPASRGRRRGLEVGGVRRDVALRGEAAAVLAALAGGAQELNGVRDDVNGLTLL